MTDTPAIPPALSENDIDVASLRWAIPRLEKQLREEGVEFTAFVLELQQLKRLAARLSKSARP